MANGRRRKIILRSTLVGLVVIFGWIAALLVLQLGSAGGYEFRRETEHVLRRISDGAAQELYRDASPRLREEIVEERFSALVADIGATLGRFRDVLAVKESGTAQRPRGKTGWVLMRLQFERGIAPGSFSYHWVAGKWRLLHLEIDVPEKLLTGVADASVSRPQRPAPEAVQTMAQTMLARLHSPEAGALLAQWASPQLKKAVELAALVEMVGAHDRAMGGFDRVLGVIHSWHHDSGGAAGVTAVLRYGRGKARATLEFVEAQPGRWQLLTLQFLSPCAEWNGHTTFFLPSGQSQGRGDQVRCHDTGTAGPAPASAR